MTNSGPTAKITGNGNDDQKHHVFDVPGAFMQTNMDELVHIRFTGKMVELLLEIDEEMYKPCVTLESGERVMYVELLKVWHPPSSQIVLGEAFSQIEGMGTRYEPLQPLHHEQDDLGNR